MARLGNIIAPKTSFMASSTLDIVYSRLVAIAPLSRKGHDLRSHGDGCTVTRAR